MTIDLYPFLAKLIVGSTKGFIRGKALSVEGHTHSQYAASSHTHTISQITSLQSELNSLKTSVSNGKSAVASAITDKGISTSATASFDTMAANIRNIPISAGLVYSGTIGFDISTGSSIDRYTSSIGFEYIKIIRAYGDDFYSYIVTPPFTVSKGNSVEFANSDASISGTGRMKYTIALSSDRETISLSVQRSHSNLEYSLKVVIEGYA